MLPLRSQPTRRAFTLVELVVVIVILGVLVAIGAFAYGSAIGSSKKSAAHSIAEQYARDASGVAKTETKAVGALAAGTITDLAADAGSNVTITYGTHGGDGSIVAGIATNGYCTPVEFPGTTTGAPVVGTTTKVATCHIDGGSLAGSPVVVAAKINWGRDHVCAVNTSGAGFCRGSATYGRLGDNQTSTDRYVMTAVNGASTWSQINGANGHTCGIKIDGTAWCWGNNTGRLGDGTTTQRTVPTAVAGGGTWTAIEGGFEGTCGIKSDSSLWCWGQNTNGMVADGTTNAALSPVQVQPGTTWSALDVGNGAVCAIKSDTTLWCWGSGTYGAVGDGTSTNRTAPVQIGTAGWRNISMLDYGVCGTKTDNSLWCWGENQYGSVGNAGNTTRTTPYQVAGSWSKAAAGVGHTCAIKTDNTLWCWGRNHVGQLGRGTTTSGETVPLEVAGGGQWASITAGYAANCGVKTDGTVLCWGDGSWGKGGQGSGVTVTSPTVQAIP